MSITQATLPLPLADLTGPAVSSRAPHTPARTRTKRSSARSAAPTGDALVSAHIERRYGTTVVVPIRDGNTLRVPAVVTVSHDPTAPTTLTAGQSLMPLLTLRRPRPDRTWCQDNAHLYLETLSDPPAPADSPTEHVAYNAGLELGRRLCTQKCARWAECLRDAVEGPPSEGFIAGTTTDERDALRASLGVTGRVVHVQDYTEGPRNAGQYLDHDQVWVVADLMPGAPRTAIAERAGCSEVSVKRVLNRPRPTPKNLPVAVSAYRYSHPGASPATIAAALSSTEADVLAAMQGRPKVSEGALRDAYDGVVLSGEERRTGTRAEPTTGRPRLSEKEARARQERWAKRRAELEAREARERRNVGATARV